MLAGTASLLISGRRTGYTFDLEIHAQGGSAVRLTPDTGDDIYCLAQRLVVLPTSRRSAVSLRAVATPIPDQAPVITTTWS